MHAQPYSEALANTGRGCGRTSGGKRPVEVQIVRDLLHSRSGSGSGCITNQNYFWVANRVYQSWLPRFRPILIYLGDKVTATRGYDEGVFPRVIAPRKTKLLNPRPTLLWMPVAGATGYKIIVRGQNARGQNQYWKTDVPSATKLDYPTGEPPLEADTDYKLIVSAGDHQSDEEAEPGLGFALLKSDKAKEVRDAEKKILALGLPDAPARLVIAYLYTAYDLNAE